MNYLILVVAIFFTVFAQLLLKKGMLVAGKLDFSLVNLLNLISQIFQNIYLLAGIISLGIAFLLWLFVISQMHLSIAYPIATGLNFVLVTIGAWLLFKEQLSLTQIMGIATIIAGVFLVLKV